MIIEGTSQSGVDILQKKPINAPGAKNSPKKNMVFDRKARYVDTHMPTTSSMELLSKKKPKR